MRRTDGNGKRWCAGAALLLTLLVAIHATAGFGPGGGEFPINTFTTGDQFGWARAIAAQPDGSFVVVWNSQGVDVPQYPGIAARLFDEAGQPIADEFLVHSYATDFHFAPTVSAATDGSFVVTWQNYYTEGSGYGIVGRRFQSSGTPIGDQFELNSFTTNWQRWPDPSVASDGSFVVVWHSYTQDGSYYAAIGRRFDSAGSPASAEFRINDFTTANQRYPRVGRAADDSFVVVWDSYGQDGSNFGVFGRRYASDGQAVGGELQVNTFTTGAQRYPFIAARPDSSFVVVWESLGQDGSGYGVFGRLLDSTGTPSGSEFSVNSFTTSVQRYGNVAADTDGSFVVVWDSLGQDGSGYGIFGQRFATGGTKLGAEFRVNTFTAGNQDYATSIVRTAPGTFVVAWRSAGQDGSGYAMRGRYLCQDDDDNGICNALETTTTSTTSTSTSTTTTSSSTTTTSTSTTTTSSTTTSTTTTTLPPLCAPVPSQQCRTGEAGKSPLEIKAKKPGKEVIKWKLKKGQASEKADFGNPVTEAPEYAFCLYDSGVGEQPSFQVTVEAQGVCNDDPCWKEKTTSFRYKNKSGNAAGVAEVKFEAGPDREARLKFKAKGVNLVVPSLPLPDGTITAQLAADNGTTIECWQVVYTEPKKNDGTQYKAKGP